MTKSAKHSRREHIDGWLDAAIVITVAVGIWTYGYAFLHVVRLESAYEECTMWRSGVYSDGSEFGRFLGLDDGLFPPKAVCRWDDGFTMNHVPELANQLLLVIAIVLVALISFRVTRRLKSRSDGTDRSHEE